MTKMDAQPFLNCSNLLPTLSNDTFTTNQMDEDLEINFKAEEVVDLAMSTSHHRGRNESQLATRLPRPLLITQVWGRSSTSTTDSLLFSLPDELLGNIVAMLNRDEVSNLALVNSACRQLARVVQFEKVTFDYSKSSMALLFFLASTRASVPASGERTSSLMLGACIQSLVIGTPPAAFQQFHHPKLAYGRRWDTESWTSNLRMISDFHFGIYMRSIKYVIQSVLPNIASVSLHDPVRIRPDLLKAILNSTTRHLELGVAQTDIEVIRAIENIPLSTTCRLETLDVFVKPIGYKPSACSYRFAAFILRHCAKSLTSFRWNQDGFDGYPKEDRPALPRLTELRRLSLIAAPIESVTEIESLILRTNDIKLLRLELFGRNDVVMDYIECRGMIPTLKRFVWAAGNTIPISFLKDNIQLELLSICLFPSPQINEDFLPILAKNNFWNLTSLELSFDGKPQGYTGFSL